MWTFLGVFKMLHRIDYELGKLYSNFLVVYLIMYFLVKIYSLKTSIICFQFRPLIVSAPHSTVPPPPEEKRMALTLFI